MWREKVKCFRPGSIKAEPETRIQVRMICWERIFHGMHTREEVKQNRNLGERWTRIWFQVKPSLGLTHRGTPLEHQLHHKAKPLKVSSSLCNHRSGRHWLKAAVGSGTSLVRQLHLAEDSSPDKRYLWNLKADKMRKNKLSDNGLFTDCFNRILCGDGSSV